MMIAIARVTGEGDKPAKEMILSVMDEIFDCREWKAQAQYETALMLQSKADGPAHLINCLSPVINKYCSLSEKKELYSMLYSVAAVNKDAPEPDQLEILELLSEYLEIGPQNFGASST